MGDQRKRFCPTCGREHGSDPQLDYVLNDGRTCHAAQRIAEQFRQPVKNEEQVAAGGPCTCRGATNYWCPTHGGATDEELRTGRPDCAMPDQAFTEDEIKRAFWTTFHKRGEVWFDHLSDPEACHESTADKWDGFLEALREQLKKRG